MKILMYIKKEVIFLAKYVVLSFDDGRKDTYFNAAKIMESNGLVGTINVTTDFIENPQKYNSFGCSNGSSMSIDNLIELDRKGFEIANHSNTHTNDKEDILAANVKLSAWGIDTNQIGFASPCSSVNAKNQKSYNILELIDKRELLYLRTGVQIRKQTIFYQLLYIICYFLKSNYIFYILNKKHIFSMRKPSKILSSVGIIKNNNIEQIIYLIDKMPDDHCIILNFHSIFERYQAEYNFDKWVWDKEKFIELCKWLSNNNNVKVINNRDVYERGI